VNKAVLASDVNSGTGWKQPAAGGAADPIRVLHLNAGNMYGGVETMLSTMASLRHLSPGMEPHFATCFEGQSSRELSEAGVPVYVLGPVRISRPWTVWRARRRLREVLRAGRFDIVICHMAWTLVVLSGVARAAGLRVAMWAHGFLSRTNWLDRLSRRNTPDLVIANSRFTAAQVREQFPKTPVHVIYCPLPLAEFPERDRARAGLRQELGAGEDTAVILQVGRLEPWKGHLVHLRALALLDRAAKWVCWIAGGPQTPEQENYLRQLEATARELGISDRVRFLGQRSDVPKLLAAADIFCQPNQGPEPFGLVYVEALWAGLPVIGSGLGGALEIVDESCGLLVEPGDQKGLAAALGRLIGAPSLRARLGSAGPGRARELCDPAARMNQLRDLSQAVAGSRVS
jgi:glycosyltransferase involved in cell wall biosynthesis